MTQRGARTSFNTVLSFLVCGLTLFLNCQGFVDAARLPLSVQSGIAGKGGGTAIGQGWADATGQGSEFGDNTDEQIVAISSSSASSSLIQYPDGSVALNADGQGEGEATGNIVASSQGQGSPTAGGTIDLAGNAGGSGITILSKKS